MVGLGNIDDVYKHYLVVIEENQQLKELLRECRYKIITDLDNARLCENSVDIEDFEYLLNRIDNAIGEKK